MWCAGSAIRWLHWHSTPDPRASLQSICDYLYQLLGCRLVVTHLAEQELMEAVAYGGDRLGSEFIGQRRPVAAWRALLDDSVPRALEVLP